MQRVINFCGIFDQAPVTVGDGRAVVTAVVERREGEDVAVEVGACYAERDRATSSKFEEPGDGGAVEVDSCVCFFRIGANGAQHGEDGGKLGAGLGGGVEGDVEDGNAVYYAVHEVGVILCWMECQL